MPSIEIPDVVQHAEVRSLQDLSVICQMYVEKEQKPCTTVTIEGKVCYAFMELDGSSQPVQCYIRLEEGISGGDG